MVRSVGSLYGKTYYYNELGLKLLVVVILGLKD